MVNSILIGKYIHKVLSEEYPGKKVFPLVANAETKFPYITYERVSIESEYCKDGCISDSVEVSINVFSTDYTESCEMANNIRKLFENKSYRSSDIYVKDCRLIDVSEEYSDTYNYNQNLTFKLILI